MQWVEDALSGKLKAPARVVATVDQAGTHTHNPTTKTFVYTAHGELEIDGTDLAVGDRVLFVAQDDGEENGLWQVTDIGQDDPGGHGAALVRPHDFEDDAHVQQGVQVAIIDGDTQSGSTWRLTTSGTITLGTTALTWISVTPATGAAVYAEEIQGDSVATEFSIEHNLGSTDVVVSIRDMADGSMVMTDIKVVDGNEVEIAFAEALDSSHVFGVTVIG
jgi:hypothetical protein